MVAFPRGRLFFLLGLLAAPCGLLSRPAAAPGLPVYRSGGYTYTKNREGQGKMAGISIGTARHTGLIKACLGREMKIMEKEGLKIRLRECSSGKYTFFSCQVLPDGQKSGEELERILRCRMARVLSDLILNHWQGLLLKDMIRENYYYFDEEEKKSILRYAKNRLGGGGRSSCAARYPALRQKIMGKLLDFLSHHNQLVVEGFIRFRLKEYVEVLEEAVERAVDDFLLEKEYREFIRLLRYFVEIQEPRVNLVHLLREGSGAFRLYDESRRPIRLDCFEGLLYNLSAEELNYDDVLISALITLAPRQITVHRLAHDKSTLVQTVRQVFGERVRECLDCPLCRGE